MEKLLGQLSTHVTLDAERQMRALAEVEGQSTSEYLRDLIDQHLIKKSREFQVLKDAFGDQRFGEFDKNP